MTYSPLGKAFENQAKTIEEQGEKQIKTIEDQGEKQIKALENRVEKNVLDTDQKSIGSFFSKDFPNEESTCKLNKIVEMENKLNRDDLIHKTGNKKKIKQMIFKCLKQ